MTVCSQCNQLFNGLAGICYDCQEENRLIELDEQDDWEYLDEPLAEDEK